MIERIQDRFRCLKVIYIYRISVGTLSRKKTNSFRNSNALEMIVDNLSGKFTGKIVQNTQQIENDSSNDSSEEFEANENNENSDVSLF